MSARYESVEAGLRAIFGRLPRPARILIVGPMSDRVIDELEAAGGALVEHLVLQGDAALKVSPPGRRVYCDRASLGARRFDLAASFADFSADCPERLLLSVLATHGESILFHDNLAVAPAAIESVSGGVCQTSQWSDRRRLFLTRLLNELGFPVSSHGLGRTPGNGQAPGGAVHYLAERGVYRPLLVHVHLPKTGGVSLQQTLESSFPGKVLSIDHRCQRGNAGNATTIHSQLIAHAQAETIGSHLLRFSYPNVLGDRLLLYFTLLRHPVEQFKSFVRFLKYNTTLYADGSGFAYQRELIGLSMVEIADVLMRRSRSDDLDCLWFLPCRFFGLTDQAEPVIRKLLGFVMVGVFERMHQSLELLRAKLAPYEMDLLVDALPHLNSSRGTNLTGEPLPADHLEQESALNAYAPIEEFLRLHHAGDFAVYDWAVANFETQWRDHQMK